MTQTRRALMTGLMTLGALGGASWAAAAATASPAEGLSEADRRDVARAVACLEALTSVRWRFVQTDGRGGRTTGALVLQRPGRARFDYDPPSGLVVAADRGMVSVVDRRLKTIHVYALGVTPLGLFLDRDIRLDRGVRVTRVTRRADGLTITAEDARRKTPGAIALDFRDNPLTLTGWTLTDARGAVISVRLEDFNREAPREASFFRLGDPRMTTSQGDTP